MVVFRVLDLSLSFWLSHSTQQDLQHVWLEKTKTEIAPRMMKPDETRTVHSIC